MEDKIRYEGANTKPPGKRSHVLCVHLLASRKD